MKQTKQPAQEERIDWKNKYLRALADYQNLVKRTEGEKQEVRRFATEQFLKKLLPVVDNLERAQLHVQDEGLALALAELHQVLVSHGVEKFDTTGKQFDPHIMDCVEVVDGQKNQVVQVLTAGYKMHEKLLRPSKVQVGGGIKEDVCLK